MVNHISEYYKLPFAEIIRYLHKQQANDGQNFGGYHHL